MLFSLPQQKVQRKLHFGAGLSTSMGRGWAANFTHWKHLNFSLEILLLTGGLFSPKLLQTKEHCHTIPFLNPAKSC